MTVLGYTCKSENEKIFKQALTHSSYANENNKKSYERLEFLGDSVLGLVIAEELFNKTELSEGELTKFKSRVVNNEVLADAIENKKDNSLKINLGSSFKGSEEDKLSIYGDIFESLVGAVYLDGGLNAAKNFVKKLLDIDSLKNRNDDYITDLKEYCEKHKYDLSQTAEEQNGEFIFKFTINNKVSAGRGPNKQKAKKAAAYEMLNILKIIK